MAIQRDKLVAISFKNWKKKKNLQTQLWKCKLRCSEENN